MADDMKYQLRLYLTDEFAQAARADARDPKLQPLNNVLDKYGLTLVNQFDALVGFCREAEANQNTDTDLYRWTKDVISQPIKEARYSKQFTLYDQDNNQVYDKAIADGAEAELLPMVGQGIITNISKYNDDPAQNPQAPEKYRSKPDDGPQI